MCRSTKSASSVNECKCVNESGGLRLGSDWVWPACSVVWCGCGCVRGGWCKIKLGRYFDVSRILQASETSRGFDFEHICLTFICSNLTQGMGQI